MNMTTRRLFPDFSAEVVVVRQGKSIKVILEEEDCTIYLNPEKVQYVADKLSEDVALVALLLAYMECIRQNTTNSKDRIKKLEEDTVAEAIVKLSEVFMIEDLIFKIRGLKWHEIKGVIEASDPVSELETVL